MITIFWRYLGQPLSKISPEGELLAGDKPSKEAFLHLAMYRERPSAKAIVHLHSTYSVALSCLADIDPADVLPPITAYAVMRVGKLPLVPYFRPGDLALAEAVAKLAKAHGDRPRRARPARDALRRLIKNNVRG